MTADSRETVRVPRATDGVGNALRQLFDRTSPLPRDMADLLNQLSRD
jgi:hypothetical protein